VSVAVLLPVIRRAHLSLCTCQISSCLRCGRDAILFNCSMLADLACVCFKRTLITGRVWLIIASNDAEHLCMPAVWCAAASSVGILMLQSTLRHLQLAVSICI